MSRRGENGILRRSDEFRADRKVVISENNEKMDVKMKSKCMEDHLDDRRCM